MVAIPFNRMLSLCGTPSLPVHPCSTICHAMRCAFSLSFGTAVSEPTNHPPNPPHTHRADIVDNANIKAGDLVVGLASFGQAQYETEYNGGMGSNGLTSARHDVFGKSLAAKYPESFDPLVPASLVYSGGWLVGIVHAYIVYHVGLVYRYCLTYF